MGNEGTAITEAQLYGALGDTPAEKPAEKTVAENAAEFAETLGMSTPADDGTGDEPVETGAEVTDDGEKPAAKPAGEVEKGAEKPAVEPERPIVSLWDTDRQKRDQEHANELKARDAKIAELEARVKAVPEVKPEARPEPTKAAERADLKEIDSAIDALSKNDEATAEDYAKVLRLVRNAAANGSVSGEMGEALKTVRKEVEELRGERKGEQERKATEDAKQAQDAAQSEFNRMLDGLDTEYSPKFRNPAYEAVKVRLVQKGYGPDAPKGLPSQDLLESWFREEYQKVSQAHPQERKGKAKPTAKPPRGDPGTGGGAVPTIKAGSLDYVAAQMLSQGKFRVGK